MLKNDNLNGYNYKGSATMTNNQNGVNVSAGTLVQPVSNQQQVGYDVASSQNQNQTGNNQVYQINANQSNQPNQPSVNQNNGIAQQSQQPQLVFSVTVPSNQLSGDSVNDTSTRSLSSNVNTTQYQTPANNTQPNNVASQAPQQQYFTQEQDASDNSTNQSQETVTENSTNDTAEEYTYLGAGYYQNENGYYCTDKKGFPQRISDFFIQSIVKEVEIGLDEVNEFYRYQLKNDMGDVGEVRIPIHKQASLSSVIENELPGFQTFTDTVAGAREKVRRAMGEVIKKAMREGKILMLMLFAIWGWGKPFENGARRFYHAGLPNCTCEKMLSPIIADPVMRKERLTLAYDIRKVAPPEVIRPLIVHTLGAYTDALFTDAGYPIRYCLMEIGGSGFGKSSLTQVLFSPFVPMSDRLVTVRSTDGSIDVLLETHFDDSLPVDDFNLEDSQEEINKKLKFIRALIRSYGDKNPRVKWAGNKKLHKSAIRGTCVINGETKMLKQIKSSELRYIKIFFEKPIDLDLLEKYQLDPSIWTHFVSEFIRHLEWHYVSIVAYLRNKFSELRKIYRNAITEPRLRDIFIHMSLINELLSHFLYLNQIITEDERKQFCSEFDSLMLNLIAKQNSDAQSTAPYILYLSELWNLIGTGKIKIAPSLEFYAKNPTSYHGYKEGGIIMIKRDEIFVIIQNAFVARRDWLPASSDDIVKQLADNALTVSDADSNLKRTPSCVIGRPRMLALIESKCLAVLDSVK